MRIAVVGTGISGLSTAWLLNQKHDVTVYEKNAYIGGHSNTVDVETPDGPIPVDTGFIVYNEANYPNLTAMFRELDVKTDASNMSFGVSIENGDLEYSGENLGTLFAQRKNLFRGRFRAMIWDLLRFYKAAPKLLDNPHSARRPDGSIQTLGEYLTENRYSQAFILDHLLPMGAAIWSAPLDEMMAFPVTRFVQFFKNHGLLRLSGRPAWRTVSGGSREYVRKLAAPLHQRIKLSTPVKKIIRNEGGIVVQDGTGQWEHFDHVVMASHSDESLSLLSDPSPEEQSILGNIRYQPNDAYLHRDPELMPQDRKVWSAWNYMATDRTDKDRRVAVTYWMSRLQNINGADDLFVSLNPVQPPREDLTLRHIVYHHPMFDAAATAAQAALPTIQGLRNTWYCGAWCGYGFHEDGLVSGLAVADALGSPAPWTATGEAPDGAGWRLPGLSKPQSQSPVTPTNPLPPLANPAPAGAD